MWVYEPPTRILHRDPSSGMETGLPRAVRGTIGWGMLTAHLLLQPVFEHGHTGVDSRLSWLPTAISPRSDSKEDLSGARAGLGTG